MEKQGLESRVNRTLSHLKRRAKKYFFADRDEHSDRAIVRIVDMVKATDCALNALGSGPEVGSILQQQLPKRLSDHPNYHWQLNVWEQLFLYLMPDCPRYAEECADLLTYARMSSIGGDALSQEVAHTICEAGEPAFWQAIRSSVVAKVNEVKASW